MRVRHRRRQLAGALAVAVAVALAGMVELRWIIFATTPPNASIPSDNGVISRSSISSVALDPPPRILACTATLPRIFLWSGPIPLVCDKF